MAASLTAAACIGLAVPALAHDDEPTPAAPYVERFDENGAIIPEQEHPVDDSTATLERLRELESSLDPAGLTSTYVCSDPGDTQAVVVLGYEDSSKKDLKPAKKLGKIKKLADPCANKRLVVGK